MTVIDENGRRTIERRPYLAGGITRTGFYPVKVMYEKYVSRAFGENMPYSIGYDPDFGTYIHQTREYWCTNLIGTRRSAGCTRLCAEEAKTLFKAVMQSGRGLVLAFNEETGRPLSDGKGNYKMISNYRTLVINTDSTPEALRQTPLPSIRNRQVIRLDPAQLQKQSELLWQFFPKSQTSP